jgi:hypothetical protein
VLLLAPEELAVLAPEELLLLAPEVAVLTLATGERNASSPIDSFA